MTAAPRSRLGIYLNDGHTLHVEQGALRHSTALEKSKSVELCLLTKQVFFHCGQILSVFNWFLLLNGAAGLEIKLKSD